MDILLLIIGCVCVVRHKYALAFTILFAFFTNFYALGVGVEMAINRNVTDLGILMFFFMLLYGKRKKRSYNYPVLDKLSKPLSLFAIFLIIIIMYDMLIRGTNIISIIKTYRHWVVLFFSPSLLRCYRVKTYERTLRYVFYVTIAATGILLAEYYLGFDMIKRGESVFINESGREFMRGSIPSSYAGIFLLILLVNYFQNIRSIWKYVFSGALFLTFVNSMIRSWTLAIIIGIVVLSYRLIKMKMLKIRYVIVGLVALFVVLFSNEQMIQRMSMGVSEMETVELGKDIETEGNMTFRLALFLERYDYIMESWDTALMGIGGIHEKEFPKIFSIGLLDIETGETIQLDTSDIAWVPLILRLGLLGICIYLFLWICVIRLFKQTSSLLGFTGYIYMMISILIAFCSTQIAMGWFWLFYFLLLIVANYGQISQQCIKK